MASVFYIWDELMQSDTVWHACVVLLCLQSTETVSWTHPWGTAPTSMFTYHRAFLMPSGDTLQLFVGSCYHAFAWVYERRTLSITWLMSLVHAAFSCSDGASRTTVNEGESDGSTTSLKSSWPNTWPPAFAVWDGGSTSVTCALNNQQMKRKIQK